MQVIQLPNFNWALGWDKFCVWVGGGRVSKVKEFERNSVRNLLTLKEVIDNVKVRHYSQGIPMLNNWESQRGMKKMQDFILTLVKRKCSKVLKLEIYTHFEEPLKSAGFKGNLEDLLEEQDAIIEYAVNT